MPFSAIATLAVPDNNQGAARTKCRANAWDRPASITCRWHMWPSWKGSTTIIS